MDLFVRSVSTGAIERSPGFLTHTCDMKERRSFTFYLGENKEAIEFLKEKDVSFSLIDLSRCSFITRLLGRIRGIKQTPTLILDNGTKLKGVERMKEHFQREGRKA